MRIEEIISQLSSLKDNSQSFITNDSDPIWKKDVEALGQAIAILSTLVDEGVDDTESATLGRTSQKTAPSISKKRRKCNERTAQPRIPFQWVRRIRACRFDIRNQTDMEQRNRAVPHESDREELPGNNPAR